MRLAFKGGIWKINKFTEADKLFRKFQIDKFDKKRISPGVSLSIDIDVTELNKIRKKLNKKITLTHVLLNVISKNLSDYNTLYACFNGKKIIYNPELVINVPVDIENHVEYVILRNPEKYNLEELANQFNFELDKIKRGEGSFKNYLKTVMKVPRIIRKFALKIPGFDSKFMREHYGNFVVTNIGKLNMKSATMTVMKPIISSIIIGKTKEINSKEMLPMTLFFDHRAVDAGHVSRFLSSVKKQMENPKDIFTS